MEKVESKIKKVFDSIETNENEEKLIFCIVSKINRETLKSTISVNIQGNKLSIVKIINSLYEDGNNEELHCFMDIINALKKE